MKFTQESPPELLMLRLVQAAVAAGCESVHLTQLGSVLRFQALKGAWDPQDLRAVVQDFAQSDCEYRSESMALVGRAIKFCLLRPLQIGIHTGGQELHLDRAGEGYTARFLRSRVPLGNLQVNCEFPAPLEARALGRACLAPLPVELTAGSSWVTGTSTYLNGYPVDDQPILGEIHRGNPTGSPGLALLSGRIPCWGNSSCWNQGLPLLGSVGLIHHQSVGRTLTVRKGLKISGPLCQVALLLLPGCSLTEVVLVHNGLMLDPVQLPWGLPVARVYAAVDDPPLDSTGLALSPEVNRADFFAPLRHEVLGALAWASRFMAGVKPPGKGPTEALGTAFGVAGVGLGLVTGTMVWPLLGLATSAGAFGLQGLSAKLAEVHQELLRLLAPFAETSQDPPTTAGRPK